MMKRKKEGVKKNKWTKTDLIFERLAELFNPLISYVNIEILFQDKNWSIKKKKRKDWNFFEADKSGSISWTLDHYTLSPLNNDNNFKASALSGLSLSQESSRSEKRRKVRRYIPSSVSTTDFFLSLKVLEIEYVILRWFDHLPSVGQGEDIDILVSDADLERLDPLFTRSYFKRGIPCDIYSESGRKGSAYKGVSYLQKSLSENILATRLIYKDAFSIPNTFYHFISLAYHAVYHKFHTSDLPLRSGEQPQNLNSEHPYRELLTDLSTKLDIKIDITIQGLHEYIVKEGYSPSIDTLRKLCAGNDAKSVFFLGKDFLEKEDYSIMVVFLRDWAVSRNMLNWVVTNFEQAGFDIKLVKNLSSDEQRLAEYHVRGGVWDRGPWPVSGGLPKAVIVGCDYARQEPNEITQIKHPFVVNQRLLQLKNLLRQKVNESLDPKLHVNILHSSDDNLEAWHYIDAVMPAERTIIASKISNGFEGKQETALLLNRGRRANTYLTYYNQTPTVLKKFKKTEAGEDSFNREKTAMKELASFKWAPEWIDAGDFWIRLKYYQAHCRLDLVSKGLTQRDKNIVAAKLTYVIDDLNSAGFLHMDFHARNIFYVSGEIKVVDFETLKKSTSIMAVEDCYDVTGVGEASPYETKGMCFNNKNKSYSLYNVLGVTFSEALEFRKLLH